MMDENMIKRFEENGFKRWTRDNMDRLYINAESLGLEITRYKTGNIFSAKFNGEEISNNYAREMINSKIWIDINTGKLMYKSGSCSTIVQAAANLMDEIIRQAEQNQERENDHESERQQDRENESINESPANDDNGCIR